MNTQTKTAHYHLPGLFEFYELYKSFLPIYKNHREYFYSWCDIASIYGSPADCLWGGGRVGFGDAVASQVFELMKEFQISSRLTFSNSLLENEHLSDKKCNELCRQFASTAASDGKQINIVNTASDGKPNTASITDTCGNHASVRNGVIIHSDLLLDYLRTKFPNLYFVSSTTKVLTDFNDFKTELNRDEFEYVVPDFRLNKDFENLKSLSDQQKEKTEFLCNECCWIKCRDRKLCYENVSRKSLGQNCPDHQCSAPDSQNGYVFSKAMKNPSFISIDDIQNVYLPMGFSNFKIEGRSLGSAMILEFLLYYMTKPEYQINVREMIYLDSSLDLF